MKLLIAMTGLSVIVSLLALAVVIYRRWRYGEKPLIAKKLTEEELRASQDHFAREALKRYTKPKRGTK